MRLILILFCPACDRAAPFSRRILTKFNKDNHSQNGREEEQKMSNVEEAIVCGQEERAKLRSLVILARDSGPLAPPARLPTHPPETTRNLTAANVPLKSANSEQKSEETRALEIAELACGSSDLKGIARVL